MFKARKKTLPDQNLSVQSSNRNTRKRSEISSNLAMNYVMSVRFYLMEFDKSSKSNNFVKITSKKCKTEAILKPSAISSTMVKITVQKSHF